MFVKSKQGAFYPLARVEQLWEEKSGDKTIQRAEIRDLGTIELFYGEVRRVVEEAAPVIPCNGDFFVLQHTSEDDGSVSLSRTPVVGWVLSPERGPLPVTLEGINDDVDRTVPVLCPSGEVILEMNTAFESEQEYLASVNARG